MYGQYGQPPPPPPNNNMMYLAIAAVIAVIYYTQVVAKTPATAATAKTTTLCKTDLQISNQAAIANLINIRNLANKMVKNVNKEVCNDIREKLSYLKQEILIIPASKTSELCRPEIWTQVIFRILSENLSTSRSTYQNTKDVAPVPPAAPVSIGDGQNVIDGGYNSESVQVMSDNNMNYILGIPNEEVKKIIDTDVKAIAEILSSKVCPGGSWSAEAAIKLIDNLTKLLCDSPFIENIVTPSFNILANGLWGSVSSS